MTAHRWRHRPLLSLALGLVYAPRSTVIDWWASRGVS